MDHNIFTADRFASPTRIVEILKDTKGFGFVVAGDKPVFIQTVREGGAAERAGLLKNDIIIKVNGINVVDCNHSEVVNHIRAAGPFVILTLIGQNQNTFNGYPTSPGAMPLSPGFSPPIQGPDIGKDRLISGPKPVDNEHQKVLDMNAVRTLQTMYQKEEESRNKLKAQQARHPNPRTAVELAQSEEILRELQKKIGELGGNRDWMSTSLSSSQLNTSTRSPPPKRPHSTFASRRSDHTSVEEEESPPPLPVRHTSKMGNPLASPVLSPIGGDRRFGGSPEVAPPLPPRNNVMIRVHEENPTHQRTKSSPFPYRGVDVTPDSRRMSTADSSDLDSLRGHRTTSPGPSSPPGSPPPPYSVEQPESGGKKGHGVTFSADPTVATQWNIHSMEDEDWSDHESSLVEDHGPYSKISTLLEAKPYLAVFINYLLCNEDPSNLFFLLITDHYKEGTSAKDMCRWAFEINTTFLVPNAPLKVQSVDETILRDIDDVLANFASKEERIRTVFLKARKKASSAVKVELDDFRTKRQAGLAGLFGPSDDELREASGDASKEMKVVEALLLVKFQEYARDDLESGSDDKSMACASALATVLSKVFNLKSQPAVGLLEKCPTFVSREKSVKSKLMNKTKKRTQRKYSVKNVSVRGHEFSIQNYLSIVECLHCSMILWGVSPQGYQCKNCKINFHRGCLRQFEASGAVEPCVVTAPRKNTPFTHIFQGIRNPKTSVVSNGSGNDAPPPLSNEDPTLGERSGSTQPISASFNGKSDLAKVNRGDSFKDSERSEFPSPQGSVCDEDTDGSHGPSSSDSKRHRTNVGRSDSFGGPASRRLALKKPRDSRKHSDPNPPPSSSNHEDHISGALAFAHSGSSSNSSLSARSLDSPGPSDSRISTSVPSDGSTTVPPWVDDSDLEADTETPDWTKTVESDVLRRLTPKEKQRQEVINELFHTERSHVRCLKVLDRVFYRPLTESNLIPLELLNLLFANLSEMIEIHSRFNTLMKQKRKSRGVIDSVGDIILSMFDGPEGDRLQRAASQFCQHQSFALEALKERRKKETKLEKFLYDAEMNPVCRRLQLKDLLPTGMQRLTKYPLLLESLLKHTPPKNPDHQPIKRALDRSREVLKAVNAAIHDSENQHRLAELQKRLDKSSFDKSDHELRNFDFNRHRLVHEGPLTLHCKDRRPIDLHVVVLKDMIVLLQKDDNRVVLKYHNLGGTGNSDLVRCSPIIKYTSILLKPDAGDSTAFYLIDLHTTSPQMYKMVSSSTSERKAWLKHITEATEGYMQRDGKKRPEPHTVTLIDLPAQTSSSSLSFEPNRTNSEESTEVPADSSSADSGVSLTVLAHDLSSVSETKLEPEHQTSTESASSQSPEPPKKDDDDSLNSISRSASTVSSTTPAKRRFQRVEILQIAEGTTLIDPKEVKVSQGNVHTAEPVLTPLEKLRRKDQLIRAALVEKQRLVAEVLHVSPEELDQLAQYDSTPIKGANQEAQEARDLVLAAIMQASKLTTVLNESLRITEEETIAASSEPTNSKEPVLVRPLIEHVHPTRECDPVSRHESFHVKEAHKPVSPRTLRKIMKLPGLASQRLVPIVTNLNAQLTQLMTVVNDRDVEREQMRRELQHLREQIATQVVETSVCMQTSHIVEEGSEFEGDRSSESPEKILEGEDVLPERAVSFEVALPSEPSFERLRSESPPISRPLSTISQESAGDGIYVEIRETAFIGRQLSNPKEETEDLVTSDEAEPSTMLISSVSSIQEEISADVPEAVAETVDISEPLPETPVVELEVVSATPVEGSAVAENHDAIPEEVLNILATIAEVNAEESSSNNSEAPPLLEDFGASSADIIDDPSDPIEAVNESTVEQLTESVKLQETLMTASEA